MVLWRKSSYSEGDSANCVELAALDRRVGLRDSKRPASGHLSLGRDGFARLMSALKRGQALQ